MGFISDVARPLVTLGLEAWFKANQACRGLVGEVAVYDYVRSAEPIAPGASAPR